MADCGDATSQQRARQTVHSRGWLKLFEHGAEHSGKSTIHILTQTSVLKYTLDVGLNIIMKFVGQICKLIIALYERSDACLCNVCTCVRVYTICV